MAWRPGWAPQHTYTPYSHLYVSCFVYGNCSCLLPQVHGEVVAWVGPPCPSALVSQQRGAFMQHYLPGEGHAAGGDTRWGLTSAGVDSIRWGPCRAGMHSLHPLHLCLLPSTSPVFPSRPHKRTSTRSTTHTTTTTHSHLTLNHTLTLTPQPTTHACTSCICCPLTHPLTPLTPPTHQARRRRAAMCPPAPPRSSHWGVWGWGSSAWPWGCWWPPPSGSGGWGRGGGGAEERGGGICCSGE